MASVGLYTKTGSVSPLNGLMTFKDSFLMLVFKALQNDSEKDYISFQMSSKNCKLYCICVSKDYSPSSMRSSLKIIFSDLIKTEFAEKMSSGLSVQTGILPTN